MHRALSILAAALAFGTLSTLAHAAEVKILTAGAMKAVVLELVPQFEKETGHKAVVDNDTAGGLAKRIEGGEAFRSEILTAGAMKAVVLELVPQFEKETGHKAVVDNDTAGGLAKRIEGGEAF